MSIDLKQNRDVDADMQRAFGIDAAPAVIGVTVPPSPSPLPSGDAPRSPRSRRWLLIAAPALVALFVLALAIRFALSLVPPAAAPRQAPTAGPAAYSAAAPRPAQPPVASVPRASPTEAAPADVTPDDFGPAPVEAPPAAPPAPDARVRAAAQLDCPPGSHEDRCIFADVLSADRRLRTAYRRATLAGVPTDDLVAIRRRWNRARGISLDAPDETIRRYDDLTAALDDLVETEQR